MKRKIYYIIYTVLQFVLGVYGVLNAKTLASNELSAFSELQGDMSKLLDLKSLTSTYIIMMSLLVVMAIVILILVLKNGRLYRNGLTITLICISGFILSDLGNWYLLALFAFILLFSDKDSKVEKKPAKKIPDIINLKTTKKDYISGALLVVVYFAQIKLVPVIYKITNNGAFSTIFYELIILGVTIWAFRGRYKRDFKYLKGNVSAYLKTALKYWGIMYLAVVATVGLQIILGANSQSVNQQTLQTMPLWYLIPSAVIFAPIVEEAVFRGVIRRYVKNDVVFIILSALSFGLLHTFLSEESLYLIIVQSLNYVAMGAVLAYSYTKTNNIYTSMLVHAFQNTLGVILIALGTFM